MTAAQSSIAAMALIDFLAPDVLADPHAVLKRMPESAPCYGTNGLGPG